MTRSDLAFISPFPLLLDKYSKDSNAVEPKITIECSDWAKSVYYQLNVPLIWNNRISVGRPQNRIAKSVDSIRSAKQKKNGIHETERSVTLHLFLILNLADILRIALYWLIGRKNRWQQITAKRRRIPWYTPWYVGITGSGKIKSSIQFGLFRMHNICYCWF